MKPRVIKCVVWDLDGTLWNGVLAEGDSLRLREEAASLVRALDERGVLQSVASRNDAVALETLERFGLRDYFLHPHFGSTAKSASIARIAERLGVSTDSVAFVDDEPYEREEVAAVHPNVVCVDAATVATLLERGDITIPLGTGINRRMLHLAEQERQAAEDAAGGPSEDFLAGLGMRLDLRRAGSGDLGRIQELMLRTNQLNTTGRFFPQEELERLCAAEDHVTVVMDLKDRFGDSGTIGFALVALTPGFWTMRMLMVSCRVQDRGVGAAVLGALRRGAHRAGARFRADYVRTKANRRMYVGLKLAGFSEVGGTEPELLLEADPALLAPMPSWIAVRDEMGALLP